MRSLTALALLPLTLISTSTNAVAGGMGFTTYFFSDSGDNSVVTTAFNLAKSILERTTLLLDIELDNVTVPPVTAVTGATRPHRNSSETFEKNRGQIILGVEQGIGQEASIAVNGYRSQEIDYIANAVIGTYTQDLFSRNTTVTLRGQYNSDKVGEVLDDGHVLNRPKTGYNGVASIAQILSPTTVLDLAYDFVYLEGFQSDPYRQVQVRDASGVTVLTDELHPAVRTRQAGTARISQMVPAIEASLIGTYRYYFDDWDVHSHTAELRLNKYIVRNFLLGLNYRFYTQTGSYFWRPLYSGQQYLDNAFRTSDYKLKPFSSNNVGFSLQFFFRGLADSSPDFEFLRNSGIEFTYFRYFNDLDFSADMVQASLRFTL